MCQARPPCTSRSRSCRFRCGPMNSGSTGKPSTFRIFLRFAPASWTCKQIPICWVGSAFDYVHYHVPESGTGDEIARDHGVMPVGSYKFVICEHYILIDELTRYVFPFIGSRDWTGSLAIDQFSLFLGAHVLQTYAGLPPLGEAKKGGLAPWQARRAAEMIRERLDTSVRLTELARECSLSVSHFARAFRTSFGMSPYRWLLERRIDRAKVVLVTGDLPIADIAILSGFSDQASFSRAFARIVGSSPARWRRAVSSKKITE